MKRMIQFFWIAIFIIPLVQGRCGEINNSKKYFKMGRAPENFIYDDKQGILKLLGYEIHLDKSIKDFKDIIKDPDKIYKKSSSIQEKLKFFIMIWDSPKRNYSVLICGYGLRYGTREPDMFLLKKYPKKEALRLGFPGPFPRPIWYGDRYLEIFSDDHGSQTSDYIDLINPSRFIECPNPIYFDPEKELLVWGSERQDKVIVQKGIDTSKQRKEFEVSLPNVETVDKYPIFATDKVQLLKKELVIKFSKLKKNVIYDISDLLK